MDCNQFSFMFVKQCISPTRTACKGGMQGMLFVVSQALDSISGQALQVAV